MKIKHYKDNGDGTVTDTTTGLMWLSDPWDYSVKPQKWQKAMDGCRKFNFAGHKDWRLPTGQELFGIVDFKKKKFPLIDDVFICPDYWYWTATDYMPTTGDAMYVGFNNGDITHDDKTTVYYVRVVRSSLCNGDLIIQNTRLRDV